MVYELYLSKAIIKKRRKKRKEYVTLIPMLQLHLALFRIIGRKVA